MNDPIEEALEKLKPAELPPALMARLTTARPQPAAARGDLWRRWLLPLATGFCAAASVLAYLYRDEPPSAAPRLAAAEPLPFERSDYLLGTSDVGVIVAPNQRPYRIMQIEWMEQDTIRASLSGPAIRVETKRREVIPVALEIF
jgi:hypothetical protein